MAYGKEIKAARERLGIFQKDIACANLSRNLLSDIEMGKVKLVPSKAWIIYKRILEIAWEQAIYYELDFDDVLETYEPYLLMKKANTICFEFSNMLNGDLTIDFDKINEGVEFASKNDIGLVRFFVYLFAGKVYKKVHLDQLAVQTYFDALDFIKWRQPNEIYTLFKLGVEEVIEVAFCKDKFQDLLNYSIILLQMTMALDKNVEAKIYYNIGLLFQKVKDYQNSKKYMNQYLNNCTKDEYCDQIDALIINSANLIEMGEIDEGLTSYMLIIDGSLNVTDYQKSVALSNAIFCISKYKVYKYKNKLMDYINQIETLVQNGMPQRGMVLCNIGKGLIYLGNTDEALIYVIRGLKQLAIQEEWADVIDTLSESYKFLMHNTKDEFILEIIDLVPSSQLSDEKYIVLLKLIIKIQSDLSTNTIRPIKEIQSIIFN